MLYEIPCISRIPVLLLVLSILTGSGFSFAAPKDLTGVRIRIGVQSVEAIGNPAVSQAATWEEKTGGTAQVIKSDFGQLFVDYMASLEAPDPLYDVLLFPSAWAADFYPYLTEMPDVHHHVSTDLYCAGRGLAAVSWAESKFNVA